MPTYIYKAVTKNGKIVKNRVEDSSRLNLIKKLKRNNLMPIAVMQTVAKKKNIKKPKKNQQTTMEDIRKNVNTADIISRRSSVDKLTLKERIKFALASSEKVKTRDLVIFTQNFYLLKKANFNNIHALSTIIESTDNITLREVLEDVLAGVEAGESMYSTMEYYSNIFPYIYINMIKVGELSGSLTNSLQQAVKYLDESSDLTKKVKSILIPNMIQFVTLLVMLVVGTLVAIPTIQKVFDSVGSKEKLPAVTMWFSNFLNAVLAYWYIPIIILVALVIGLLAYLKTPKGKYNFDYFKYSMPIFGKLIYAIDFSRLIKAVLLNVQNGMRIQDALEVGKNVAQNFVLLSIIETSINNIYIGQSWIDPFEKAGFSSPMITEMLNIGMKTDLAEMMEKLLEYMEMDIDQIMNKIMKTLPQVVYVIVGAVLIFFVLVVLVPILQVYMGNFLFSAYDVQM